MSELDHSETPFVKYNLKDNNPLEDGKIITIRLNVEEYKQLQEMKKALNLRTESSALKVAALCGWNVLQNTLGASFLKWLADPTRRSRDAT